ncbi:hypothetical protein M885DRAFT_524886, partial [Pelagophyceae sp. CCMP2097]
MILQRAPARRGIPSTEDHMEARRVRVPNDNGCLFSAVAYLCDGGRAATREEQLALREVVALAVLADADAESRALVVGQPVEAYAAWIRDEFHWGGEHEIIVFSQHYGVRLCVVSADGLLTYGDGGPTAYLLYTGTHYDALVGVSQDAGAAETRFFAGGAGVEVEAAFRAVAVAHRAAAQKRDASEQIFRIKCGGCGAKLADSAAFAKHCGEFEHDDDFAYDCEDIFEATYEEAGRRV